MPAAIQNVVVLMFENRSYDNVLGKLYDASYAPPYDAPPPGQAHLRGLPVADPGEPFADMAQQILGLTEPPSNGNPYAGPPGPYGLMGGFVANYERQKHGPVPAQIMMHMTPALMPVTAFLANRYMICDEWFGSVPSQTFSNRLFSLCAQSGAWPEADPRFSYIDDLEYLGLEHFASPVYFWFARLKLRSIFSQLDKIGVAARRPGTAIPNWKLYFHDYSNTAALLEYVKLRCDDPAGINVGQYDLSDYSRQTTYLANKQFTTFADDLAAETLAPFTLIEPRYSNNFPGAAKGNSSQSNHPGVQAVINLPWDASPAVDTFYGELLLLDVYSQLRRSAYWPHTLLIVVYDEHGGCYDHLPPVRGMARPSETTPPTEMGFDFTVSGPRVPALIVSPFAEAGTTLRARDGATFDHTSIIKTVWECFDLDRTGDVGLTDRDRAAPSILRALSESAVNDTDIPPTPTHP